MYNHKPFEKKLSMVPNVNKYNNTTEQILSYEIFHKKSINQTSIYQGKFYFKIPMKLTFLMSSSFRGIFSYEEFVYIVYFLELNHKAFYFDINLPKFAKLNYQNPKSDTHIKDHFSTLNYTF